MMNTSAIILLFDNCLAEKSNESEGRPHKTDESDTERHESEFCLKYTHILVFNLAICSLANIFDKIVFMYITQSRLLSFM